MIAYFAMNLELFQLHQVWIIERTCRLLKADPMLNEVLTSFLWVPFESKHPVQF